MPTGKFTSSTRIRVLDSSKAMTASRFFCTPQGYRPEHGSARCAGRIRNGRRQARLQAHGVLVLDEPQSVVRSRRRAADDMVVIVEDVIRMLESASSDLRRGHHRQILTHAKSRPCFERLRITLTPKALEQVARAALETITPADTIGAVRSSEESDGIATVRFGSNLPGYVGWDMVASLAVDGKSTTVLETELLAGDNAIQAPIGCRGRTVSASTRNRSRPESKRLSWSFRMTKSDELDELDDNDDDDDELEDLDDDDDDDDDDYFEDDVDSGRPRGHR